MGGCRKVLKPGAWCSGTTVRGYFDLQRTLGPDMSLDVSRQKCRLVGRNAADRVSQPKSEPTIRRENMYTQGSRLPSWRSPEFLELDSSVSCSSTITENFPSLQIVDVFFQF